MRMWTTQINMLRQNQQNSTAEFIKIHSGNSEHIDEVELEALAELMDHPIEHVIKKINMFVFPDLEETNKFHI